MVKNPLAALLWVEILDAKPNPMFAEWQTRSIRFLRFNRWIPCVACGKKVKIHWTMLCDFKAADMSRPAFTLQYYDKIFAPLTPVCSDHPLAPALPEPETKTQKENQ